MLIDMINRIIIMLPAIVLMSAICQIDYLDYFTHNNTYLEI